ncbi:phosphatidylserine decarboxylase-like protein [Ceratobasidium sp. AG-I]|nr:phosphatidylserine decarboxylase-like protein [Ceratobasidium sp. AG-I]
MANPKLVEHRIGGWLPRDQRVLDAWLAKLVKEIRIRNKSVDQLSPVIQDFKTLIESDPTIWMGFHQMFDQVPQKPPYNNDPTGQPQIRDYMTMLQAFDIIITKAPGYEHNDLVGFPINAILDWPMGTEGGLATFLIPTVNAQFKAMFDVWAKFLTSPASCSVLTTDTGGWFSPQALDDMPNFAELFICDSSAPHYGFKSWDDFFTRQFRPGMRPFVFADNSLIINNACESTVYNIAYNVNALDTFWIKEQPYSLNHMLNNDPLAPQFVGGTVYQAFLSALNYHRWHCPVSGTVAKIVAIPGAYYSESPSMGFPNPDPEASNGSQSFITAVATRTLVFIQADNPLIGLICFIAVGMAEVSTCEVTVRVEDSVKKGDPLGMFHFGGSTHCLVFRPETKLTFEYSVNDPVQLGSAIASVSQL